MLIRKKTLLCGGIFALLLTGCATAKPALEGTLDPKLGYAVRANIQAQAIAPTAQQKANTYIPADPSRAALARKNYRENTVQAPQTTSPSGSGR